MILTITLNPALDKSFHIDRLEPDHKLRCPNPLVEAGGGGINVARGIRRLGGRAEAFLLSGGRNGQHLQQLVAAEGIPLHPSAIAGETRESIMVVEAATGRQYRIVAEGPSVTPAEAEALLRAIDAIDPCPDWAVLSGSLPAGLPTGFYGTLAARLHARGARVILDTGGPPLQAALHGHVWMVKPNLSELAALCGRTTLELDEVDDAARRLLCEGGLTAVAVSMGAAGAMLVTAEDVVQAPAPVVPRRSTVGAGDSMVAGMAWALHEGKGMAEALRMGVACGTAATMNPGTQLFQAADAHRLYQWLTAKNN
jgi:6-phosphofructokinase 2